MDSREATETGTRRSVTRQPLNRGWRMVAGYVAGQPDAGAVAHDGRAAPARSGFLDAPETTPAIQQLYDDDVAQLGFVMNLSRLWAYQPESHDGLFGLLGDTARAASLTFRQRGVLVTACASALGDSYCSLAWGRKLAGEVGADVAGAVLRGTDDGLDSTERALGAWARKVARDPNAIVADDLQPLRDAGFDDAQIFAITFFVALRVAFATVNDALGALPDRELGDVVPAPVRDAVTFGRPVA